MPNNKKLQEIALASLYQTINLSKPEFDILNACLDDNYIKDDIIDIFCIHCNEQSIFKLKNHGQLANNVKNTSSYFKNKSIPLAILHFDCTRNSNHYFGIMLTLKDDGIMKVGQYPSKADIEFPQWDKYSKVIDKTIITDIKKACGLAAHGIGAGSFVYLRRVIEHLLKNAYTEAIKEKSINEDKFQKSRVIEKITLLKDFLPKILYENKEAYSILSKGVHELSEEECIMSFGLLEETIELILEEVLTTKNRLKKEEEIKQKIADTYSKFKNP